jgi:hypothetical protein
LIYLQKLVLEGFNFNKTLKNDIENFLIIKMKIVKQKQQLITGFMIRILKKLAGIFFINTISDAEIANKL